MEVLCCVRWCARADGEDERLCLFEFEVDLLQDGDGEGGRLACARLRLCDGVVVCEDGHDAALLDGRRLLEAVRVDAAQQLVLEVHVIERSHHLIPALHNDSTTPSASVTTLFTSQQQQQGLIGRTQERELACRGSEHRAAEVVLQPKTATNVESSMESSNAARRRGARDAEEVRVQR